MFCFSVFFIFLILFFGIIIDNSALDLGVTIPDGYRRTWQGEGSRPAHWYLTTCFLRVFLPQIVAVDSEPHITQPVCRVFLIYDLSPGILRVEWSRRPASKLPRIPAPEPKKIRLEEGTQLMRFFFFYTTFWSDRRSVIGLPLEAEAVSSSGEILRKKTLLLLNKKTSGWPSSSAAVDSQLKYSLSVMWNPADS